MAQPVHPLPTPIPPEKPSASAAFIPETRSLATLHRAAADCTGCDLFRRGTQVVFGEGPKHARLVLIGEQPGDQEDLAGRPFVGPAGALLARVLDDVQIDRDEIYVDLPRRTRDRRRCHSRTAPNHRESSYPTRK